MAAATEPELQALAEALRQHPIYCGLTVKTPPKRTERKHRGRRH